MGSETCVSVCDLLQAAADNNVEILRSFIDDGGLTERVRNTQHRTLLHVTASEGAHDALALLLRDRRMICKIDARDCGKHTALHLAAAIGDEVSVRKLASAGALLGLQDERGCTPLHLAIKFEQADATRALLELRSDPCIEDAFGKAAIDMARSVKDKQLSMVLASLEPQRRPSTLWELAKRLLRCGRGYEAKAMADLGEGATSPPSPPPPPPPPARRQPMASAKVVSSPISKAEDCHGIAGTADGESGGSAESEDGPLPPPPPREASAGNVSTDAALDGRPTAAIGHELLSAVIAEAAREQARRHSSGTNGGTAKTSFESAAVVNEGATSETLQIEWHGLEPVFIRQVIAPSTVAEPDITGAQLPGPYTNDDVEPERGRGSVVGAGTVAAASAVLECGRAASAPPRPAPREAAATRGVASRDKATPHSDRGGTVATSSAEAPQRDSPNSFRNDESLTPCRKGEEVDKHDEDEVAVCVMSAAALVTPRSPSLFDEVMDEIFTFPFQMFFDEQVKRLEFEVDWNDHQPSVGAVKPGGAAYMRGIRRGDYISMCNGTWTNGKDRQELLPFLKVRPLVIQVNRVFNVSDPRSPYIELELSIDGCSDDDDIDITWCGVLPIATEVRNRSAAWAAGMLEGDAIVGVGGQDARAMSRNTLKAAIRERPLAFLLWRRPVGADLAMPWIDGAESSIPDRLSRESGGRVRVEPPLC